MKSNENKNISTPEPAEVTTYVPERQLSSIEITPKRSIAGIFVLTLVIGWGVFAWMQYKNEANVRESEKRFHESELTIRDEGHEQEIEQLKHYHEKELESREDVYEARLEQEHEKGFVADYIQPWIDWFQGAEIEAGIEAPNGVGGSFKLKPNSDN